MQNRLVVVNPGTHPEPMHLAVGAAASAGQDVHYLTASMLASDSAVMRVLDASVFRRLKFVRFGVADRTLPEPLFASRVKTFALGLELLHLTTRTLAPRGTEVAIALRNEVFERRSADYLRRHAAHIIVAQQTAALDVFRATPNRLHVLNYPIAHHRWTMDYLAREASQNPDWAPFLQGHQIPARVASRLDAEVEAADRILVGSHFVKETFAWSGVDVSRVDVLPLGTVISSGQCNQAERPGQSHASLRILFAGQVNQRKGLSYLLEALDRLPADRVSVRFVGPVSSILRERLRRWPRIHLIGAVPKSEMFVHYRWADIMVLPSLVEGFPLTAIESMSCGTPVMVTPNSFGTDVISHGVDGFVVPARDSDAIADVLRSALQRDVDLVAIGSAARERAKEFSWEAYERRAANYVERLCR